jgi:gas vesicle protein
MANKDSRFFIGFIIGSLAGAIYGLLKGPRIALHQNKKAGVIGILPADSVKESIQTGKELAQERLKSSH